MANNLTENISNEDYNKMQDKIEYLIKLNHQLKEEVISTNYNLNNINNKLVETKDKAREVKKEIEEASDETKLFTKKLEEFGNNARKIFVDNFDNILHRDFTKFKYNMLNKISEINQKIQFDLAKNLLIGKFGDENGKDNKIGGFLEKIIPNNIQQKINSFLNNDKNILNQTLSSIFGTKLFDTKSIERRDIGGFVEAGRPYLVGERGSRPELFIPQTSGSVKSNPQNGSNINLTMNVINPIGENNISKSKNQIMHDFAGMLRRAASRA